MCPCHQEALYHRARALHALGRLEEARRALERVVVVAPGEADVAERLKPALLEYRFARREGSANEVSRASRTKSDCFGWGTARAMARCSAT